jgi:type III restriction enzyme
LAKEEFEASWKKHKSDIQKLPASIRTRFQMLVQASGKAAAQDWELPDKIVEKKDGDIWQKHLYCDESGNFTAKLNSWETELLSAELGRHETVCWLRNLPRRDWALCIPYELGGLKPFYPDFVVIRKKGKDFVTDVLEPHDDSRVDTWAKAKGLAAFADEHGMQFGRLIIARKKRDQWQLADVNDKTVREKARKMQSSSDLESLFS